MTETLGAGLATIADDRTKRDLAAAARFASFAHELRTPMNAILGYAELLIDGSGGPLDPRARDYCAQIQDAARGLGDLVDLILATSELEGGTPITPRRPLALRRLFEDARRDLLFAGGAPELLCRPPDAEIRIDADPVSMRKLALALLRFARLRGGVLRIEPWADNGIVIATPQPIEAEGEGGVLLAFAGAAMAAQGGELQLEGRCLRLIWGG